MNNQFQRFELLIGESSLNKLKSKNVLVFGLGGVGGNVCDAIARSGIEHFTIVDNDVVDITNINRQLIANTNTIGKAKVDVMESHLKSINPNIVVKKIKAFYLPENESEISFDGYDYVIDAIDTVTSKVNIIFRCKSLNIPVISALGCGNKLDPTQVEVSDLAKTSYDPLAKVMRRELKKKGITHVKVVYSKEPQKSVSDESSNNGKHIPGSSPFVPPVAGIIIASEVIKDLLERE